MNCGNTSLVLQMNSAWIKIKIVEMLLHIFLPTLSKGVPKGYLRLIGRSLPVKDQDIIQVSVVALQKDQGKLLTNSVQVVGQLIEANDNGDLPQPHLSSVFIVVTIQSQRLNIESVTLEGRTIELENVIVFHFDPSVLQHAHKLRQFPENESGLPDILHQFQELSSVPSDCYPLLLPNSDCPTENAENEGTCCSSNEDEGTFWNRSMGVTQLLFRFKLFKQLTNGKVDRSNLVTLLIIDLIIGLAVSEFLQSFPHLYSTLHTQVHQLLKILLQLLNWLNGSPAGLKLNSSLNSLLSRFFSYHLHLWANYIGILEPILSFILSTIIWVGPLGFTLQLSLMKDLLSMATFHVYCLYIYATRLYRVLTMAIKSLGRLFMGRKWNPLRNRVDHVQISVSELFLGALFFTIGIFLAPTVIVYYIVFLSLRIPVLVIEDLLRYVVDALNACRPITSFLILSNNPRVCDQISLEPLIRNKPYAEFELEFQATSAPFPLPQGPMSLVTTLKHVFAGKVLSK